MPTLAIFQLFRGITIFFNLIVLVHALYEFFQRLTAMGSYNKNIRICYQSMVSTEILPIVFPLDYQ